MEREWIKLYRKIDEWEWATVPNTCYLFMRMILMANTENKRWRGMEIKKGQFFTSLNSLSEATGLTNREVRTALKNLTSSNDITDESSHNGRLISICNYDKYQAITSTHSSEATNERQTDDKQATNERQTDDKQATNERQQLENNKNNKNKEEYKEKNKKEKSNDLGASEFSLSSKEKSKLVALNKSSYLLNDNYEKNARKYLEQIPIYKKLREDIQDMFAAWFAFDSRRTGAIKPLQIDTAAAIINKVLNDCNYEPKRIHDAVVTSIGSRWKSIYAKERPEDVRSDIRLGFGEYMRDGCRYYKDGDIEVQVPLDASPRLHNRTHWISHLNKWVQGQ